MSAPGSHGGGPEVRGPERPEFVRAAAEALPLMNATELVENSVEGEHGKYLKEAEEKLKRTNAVVFGGKKFNDADVDRAKRQAKIVKKAKELVEKKLTDEANNVYAHMLAGTTPPTDNAEKIIGAHEHLDHKTISALLFAIETMLANPSIGDADIAQKFKELGERKSIRSVYFQEELSNGLIGLLSGSAKSRVEKIFNKSEELLETWNHALALVPPATFVSLGCLALRDKMRAHEQKKIGEAASEVAKAMSLSPRERAEAEEYLWKQGERLENVLAAITRKDERAGGWLSGEKMSKDFWRLQGRAMTHWLSESPKARATLKFGKWTLMGGGIAALVMLAFGAVLTAGGFALSGYLADKKFKGIFSGGGGSGKPSGGGGGGHGGGH